MSDSVTFATPVTPPEGKPGKGQEGAKQTPAAPSLAEFEAVLEKKLGEWDRKQQGLRRKQEDRIRKEFERQLATLTESGLEVPDAARQRLYNNIVQSVASEEVDAPPAPGMPTKSQEPPPPASQTDGTAARVERQLEKIKKRLGVMLDWEDPESQGLKEITDPDDFVLEYQERASKKAARLNLPPGAILPLGGGAPQTSASLEEAYISEMMAARGKGASAVFEIKEKYKKRGLEVDTVPLYRR